MKTVSEFVAGGHKVTLKKPLAFKKKGNLYENAELGLLLTSAVTEDLAQFYTNIVLEEDSKLAHKALTLKEKFLNLISKTEV